MTDKILICRIGLQSVQTLDRGGTVDVTVEANPGEERTALLTVSTTANKQIILSILQKSLNMKSYFLNLTGIDPNSTENELTISKAYVNGVEKEYMDFVNDMKTEILASSPISIFVCFNSNHVVLPAQVLYEESSKLLLFTVQLDNSVMLTLNYPNIKAMRFGFSVETGEGSFWTFESYSEDVLIIEGFLYDSPAIQTVTYNGVNINFQDNGETIQISTAQYLEIIENLKKGKCRIQLNDLTLRAYIICNNIVLSSGGSSIRLDLPGGDGYSSASYYLTGM